MDKGEMMADKDTEKRLGQLEKELKRLGYRLSKIEKTSKKADKEAKKAKAAKADAPSAAAASQ